VTTGLGVFAKKTVTVALKTNYSEPVEVTLRLPSYHHYQALLAAVPAPVPPKIMTAARREVPDLEDETYKQQLRDRAIRQNYLVLVDALVEGGMEIPGATLDEQVDVFIASEPDAGMVMALLNFITAAISAVRAQPDDAPFRAVHAAGDAGVPTLRNDAAGVAGTS